MEYMDWTKLIIQLNQLEIQLQNQLEIQPQIRPIELYMHSLKKNQKYILIINPKRINYSKLTELNFTIYCKF
jgi:hypothetical protein